LRRSRAAQQKPKEFYDNGPFPHALVSRQTDAKEIPRRHSALSPSKRSRLLFQNRDR
jgi:hypothetical protein